jgi:CII-binding regulator of phage lambda lysogenization HflD
VNLFGLQLLSSKALITHERAMLSGRFLGLETMLDIAWTGDNPHFTGSAALRVQRSLGLGAIYIKGVKVADNYTLDLDIDIHFYFDFDKNGFACDARCKFKIEGVGFDVGFALKVPPVEVDEIVTMLKQELIDKAGDYLAHVFGSALAYIENVANGAIEWTTDTYDDFVDALTEGYQQTIQDLANLGTQIGTSTTWMVEVMVDGFGATLNEVGSALNTAGQEIGAIADGLVQGAEATFDDVGNVLESLGKTPEQIAGALQTVGATLQTVTDTLQHIGATVEQITAGIASIGAATDQLGTLLKNAGFNHKDISKGMNAIGKSMQDIANSLKRALFDEKAIAEGLFYIGKAGDQIAAALKYVGYGIDQVSQAFKDLGKDAETLMRSLKHAFGTQWQTFTNRLKALGYPLSHITRALDIWCSDSEVAGYLKGAGVGLYDIAVLLKNTLGAGYSTCYDILVGIGYSATEVTKVLLNVF